MIVKGIKRYSWILLVIMLAVFWKAPLHAEAATTQVDNLVLMVNFSEDGDNTFSTNFNKYQEMYTGTASAPKRSLEKYISTISDEQVKVNNYFPQVVNGQFIPITITGTAQQYPNASDGELFVGAVINAVNQAGLSLPSKLDSRYNNGYIDNLTIIVQVDKDKMTGAFGSRKADWGDSNTLLGGQWKVGAYNVLPTNMLGVGTLTDSGYSLASHEFLHTLGAPDLYRTSGETGDPVGRWWDLMAGPNYTASYPLTYTRKELGWMSIGTLTESGTYTLRPAEESSGTRAYILKTSRSDSEFFVVEYRQKPSPSEREDYDFYIPESGLIVYRVNNAVENHTNKAGDNYIYVFRKDTLDPAKAQEEVMYATVGGQYRKALGSSDMDAPYTADTIFYSDGSNSGIVIDQVQPGADGSISFHVEFPVLSADSYWQQRGESITGLCSPAITGDAAGSCLYLAGIVEEQGWSLLKIYSSQAADGRWTEMPGSAISQKMSPVDLLNVNGDIYVAYMDTSGYVHVSQADSMGLNSVYTSQTAVWPQRLELFYEQGKLWVSWMDDKSLQVINLSDQSGPLPALTVQGASISGAKLFYYGGNWYASYCDYMTPGANGRVAVLQQQGWQDVYTMNSLGKISYADVCVSGNVLYLAALNNATAKTALITYDGTK